MYSGLVCATLSPLRLAFTPLVKRSEVRLLPFVAQALRLLDRTVLINAGREPPRKDTGGEVPDAGNGAPQEWIARLAPERVSPGDLGTCEPASVLSEAEPPTQGFRVCPVLGPDRVLLHPVQRLGRRDGYG